MPLDGTVLITGGSQGIGRACAAAVAAAGARPVLLDLDEERGRQAAAELGGIFVPCDVSDADSVERAVAAGVDVGGGVLTGVVNNAGRTARASFAETDLDTWRSVQRTNLDGVYHVTRSALPALRRGTGAIVNIASVAGLVGEEGLAAYSSTKGAIIALTRSLALELRGIRVNAVCPGQINTRLMVRVTSDPVKHRAVAARIPVGRLGEPAEVAEVVAWLLSSAASFVNGVAIPVDGGETAGIAALPDAANHD